ncbi:unannotated protein [freshwater metagenome]|uniref:Unannotated protein n=1 Tax=freshwater metagenome TaxID=449393 RepID=A0A6J7C951_9ZZZZ
MHQTVAAGEDVDEGTELGHVDDAARVDLADFSHRRGDDRLDAGLGLFHAPRLDGADGDDALGAVVVDGDVGTGLLGDGVDDLALRPDDLTDLVHRDEDRGDLRCRCGNLGTGSGETCIHVLEDRRTGFLGLIQSGGQDVGGDAVDLGVELQGGDRIGRTGDLEVHVAEGILGAEDVGERGVLTLGKDQTHGDTGHGSLHRHAGVHQGQRTRADRRHRGAAVGGEHFGDEAQGVVELVETRQHRQQRTGGERTVADLAALGRTHATRLTVGPRGHVVVEQEVLVRLRAERVEQLVHARHGHGDDVHHLGLATLEQAGAVSGGQCADFAGQRTQIAGTATVDAQALVDDALAHQLLGEAAHSLLHSLLAAGKGSALATQLGDRVRRRSVGGGVALGLPGDGDSGLDGRGADALDRGEHLGAVIGGDAVRHRHDRALGGDDAGDELALQGDAVLDVLLAGIEATGQGGLVDLRGAIGVVLEAVGGTASLNHHDRDVTVVQLTAGDDELEGALGALFVGGVRDPLAGLGVGDADGADRAVEGDTTDHQRGAGGIDRQHVVRVGHIGAEDREHDLGLVAETIRKCGAKRPVGEAAGEDRVLGGAAFTTEERTRDLAGRIGPLFHVDREGEELHPRLHVLGGVGRGQHRGAAQGGNDGTHALLSKLAGLERQGFVRASNGAGHSNGFCHDELLSTARESAHGVVERRTVPSRQCRRC